METISERIRRLRGERSRKDLGEKVGVTEQAVGLWERGNTSKFEIDHLLKLAREFKCSVDELLTGKPPRRAIAGGDTSLPEMALSVARAYVDLAPSRARIVDALFDDWTSSPPDGQNDNKEARPHGKARRSRTTVQTTES